MCAEKLKFVMQNELPYMDYEHIFADNSSTDGTFDKLKSMALNDDKLKIILNSRNVGPFRNMWNALKSSTGDAVIPFLPADLQDPPEVIPKFIKKWESGDMVVFGVRKNRQENFFMTIFRNIFYRIISKFAEENIPRNSGEFLLADKLVIKSILELDDQYPYIRGLIAQTGVRFGFVDYTWAKWKNGKSRLRFLNLVDQAINGFVSTSRLPARITLLAGFILSITGVLGAIFTLILVLVGNKQIPAGIPTIIITLFFFGGIQLFFLGLIGEYVLSIHGQVRPRPKMFELEKINF